MADKRITDLPELIQADSGDFIPIVDSSMNVTKRVAAEKVLPRRGDFISVGLGGDAVVSNSSGNMLTAQTLLFSTVQAVSGDFSISSNGIVIPDGVRSVTISAMVYFGTGVGSGGIVRVGIVNRTANTVICRYITRLSVNYESSSTGGVPAIVNPGDVIQVTASTTDISPVATVLDTRFSVVVN